LNAASRSSGTAEELRESIPPGSWQPPPVPPGARAAAVPMPRGARAAAALMPRGARAAAALMPRGTGAAAALMPRGAGAAAALMPRGAGAAAALIRPGFLDAAAPMPPGEPPVLAGPCHAEPTPGQAAAERARAPAAVAGRLQSHVTLLPGDVSAPEVVALRRKPAIVAGSLPREGRRHR
jgi:hypothetical protein